MIDIIIVLRLSINMTNSNAIRCKTKATLVDEFYTDMFIPSTRCLYQLRKKLVALDGKFLSSLWPTFFKSNAMFFMFTLYSNNQKRTQTFQVKRKQIDLIRNLSLYI